MELLLSPFLPKLNFHIHDFRETKECRLSSPGNSYTVKSVMQIALLYSKCINSRKTLKDSVPEVTKFVFVKVSLKL